MDQLEGDPEGVGGGAASVNAPADWPALVAAAQLLVAEHSELYKEQKAGDSEATVEGCFPPAETMDRKRVTTCLAVLSHLYAEVTAPATMQTRVRIFHVRDGPLHSSLKDFDNEEGLADLKTVTDYMLLPRSLNEALELEIAVVKARRDYQAAIGGYNLLEATTPKPRLLDFLGRDEQLRAAMASALGQYKDVIVDWNHHDFETMPLACLVPGGGHPKQYESWRGAYVVDYQGVQDGLMGEPLSQYGFAPSTKRLFAYASGCILARRPVPSAAAAIPDSPTSTLDRLLQDARYRESCNSGDFARLAGDPFCLAARLGDVAALNQFEANGLDLGDQRLYRDLIRSASRSGSVAVLEWLYDFDPDAFEFYGPHALDIAVHMARWDAAWWMVEELGIRTGWKPVDESSERICSKATCRVTLDALKWLHSEAGFALRQDVAEWACELGDGEMLDWYFSNCPAEAFEDGCAWGWDAFEIALLAGHLTTALSLLDRSRPEFFDPARIFTAACRGFKGDTAVLDRLMAVEPSIASDGDEKDVNYCFASLSRKACQLGYPQALEWITRQPGKEDWYLEPLDFEFQGALEATVRFAQLECARWLVTRVTPSKLGAAVEERGGKKFALKRYSDKPSAVPSVELVELLAPYYDVSCYFNSAIAAADTDVIRTLKTKGFELAPYDSCADHFAAYRLLMFDPLALPDRPPRLPAVAEACELDRIMRVDLGCEMAAPGGSVHVMAFVAGIGGKLTSKVLHEAAVHGHLPLCRWLRQQGVEWPEDLAAEARSTGADEVAAWVEQEQAEEKTPGQGGAAAAK